jgi:hypothetical protein
MIAKFPTLDNYEDAWPVDVILINLLKYSTAKGKDKDTKDGVALIQKHK